MNKYPHSRILTCLIAILLAFLSFPPFPGSSALQEVTTPPPGYDQVLISTGENGRTMHPAVAVDSQGIYHLAFIELYNGIDRIVYATYDPDTTDITQTPLARTTDEWFPEILIDPNDNVHLFYVRQESTGEGVIIHTTGAPGSWTHTPLTAAPDNTYHPSAAVDALGTLHVAYVKSSTGTDSEIYYAKYSWGVWVESQVTNNTDYDSAPALAVDADGFIHIAYVRANQVWYTTNTTGSWVHEQVGSTGFEQRTPSIAVDAGGNVHITYRKGELTGQPPTAEYTVEVVRKVSSLWVGERVAGPWDTSAGLDSKAHLAIDLHNQIYVSYVNAVDQEVYVAVKSDGASWQSSRISENAYLQPQAVNGRSLLVDHRGHIAAVYAQDGVPPNPTQSGTVLVISKQPVTPEQISLPLGDSNMDGMNWELTVNLDALGLPHISYYYPQYKSLHVLYKNASNSGVWQENSYGPGDDVGRYHDIIVLNNTLHEYAFYNADYGNLEYLNEGGPAFAAIDSGGDVGQYVSFAWSSETRNVSYYDGIQGDLKYAVATYPLWDWITETVESAGDVGMFTSIDLDGEKHPHIAYYDYDNAALKHAYFNGSSWITETVDSGLPHYGFDWDISLKFGWDDYLHIAYYDAYNSALKHAWYDGAQWYKEVVDNNGDVGQYNAIDVDDWGYAHIAYYDWFGQDLKYARWNGMAWEYQWVAKTGSVGWYVDMVLDDMQLPHIAYFDATQNKVMYVYTYINQIFTPMVVK